MFLKRREYPQRKIRLSKSAGSIQWTTGILYLFFLMVLLCALLQTEVYRTASVYMEDALAASNLASAVIDIEEYGMSHTVKINSPVEAFERYKSAVKENLQLNDSWECANTTLISGPVSIETFIVYNVDREGITICTVAENGAVNMSNKVTGTVKAPNDMVITHTSIYSEIAFDIDGVFGTVVRAHKGKLVDIVADVPTEEIMTEENEILEQI